MTENEEKSPAHRGRGDQDRLKREIQKKEKDTDLQKNYRQVAKTVAGQAVLRDIMENKCGFKLPSVVRETRISEDGRSVSVGDILPISTMYNDSKRDVWIEIRKMIPVELVNTIEMEKLPDDEDT